MRVLAECSACNATGLYQGFAEPKGVAVVCLKCSGTGCETINYKPFSKRRGCRGVNVVKLSAGTFIATGCGPAEGGGEVTYQQFQKGNLP